MYNFNKEILKDYTLIGKDYLNATNHNKNSILKYIYQIAEQNNIDIKLVHKIEYNSSKIICQIANFTIDQIEYTSLSNSNSYGYIRGSTVKLTNNNTLCKSNCFINKLFSINHFHSTISHQYKNLPTIKKRECKEIIFIDVS